LAGTTILIIRFYTSNLQIAFFCPYWIETLKKYISLITYDLGTIIPLIGQVSNATSFVMAIVVYHGKVKNGTIMIGSIGQWHSHTIEEWL
jgi:hypothetical protein